jgi:hypothetical protein
MDLSGKLIEGTGSYVIKEVAPPVESGQLLVNNDFSAWTADDPDDWNISTEDAGSYVTEVSGKCRIVRDGSSMVLSQAACTVGRRYVVTVKTTSYDGTGDLRINGHTAIKYDITGVGIIEWYFIASSSSFTLTSLDGCDITIDWVTLEEVPEGYPILDKGDKYLECTTDGSIAIASDQAYGEWEWDWYKEGDANQLYFSCISDGIGENVTNDSYIVFVGNTEPVWLRRTGSAGNALPLASANSYIEMQTWYRFKLIRTLDGEFHLYIKGGRFGTNDWTLVSVTGGSGTNPVTDNSYTVSRYFVIDVDGGCRIANLEMRNIVRQ